MTVNLIRYAVLETLQEGLFLLSALEAPSISAVGTDPAQLQKNVARLLTEQIERGGTGDVWFGNLGGPPQAMELELVLEAPHRQPACQADKRMRFQVIHWEHDKELTCAFVPALDLHTVVPAGSDFAAAIERQLREALQRLRILRMLDQLAWSLTPLAVEVVRLELAVTLPTPLEEAREEEEASGERVLPEIGSDVTSQKLPVHDAIDEPVTSLAEALADSAAGSALLVGESGCGKTSVFRELVRRRREFGLGDWEFWESSGSRLIAGMTGFGMWQERCGKLVREAEGRQLLVHLGNLVELLDVGKSLSSPLGIASYLKPYLARGQLRVVAECTPEQLALIEREDPYLLQVFLQIPVPRPGEDAVRTILSGIAERTTPRKRPELGDDVISEIDRLHRRFAPYSAYPGRPVRFLRNLLADAGREEPLTPRHVQQAFAAETGLPLLLLDDGEPLDLAATERHFSNRLIGQGDAVGAVVDLLATVKAGLSRPKRPIGSLLFIGPTGVGKTEMAKALATFLFGDAERIIRFDMSEYADWFAVDRLTGARAQEGLLTAKVREQPFSVILLDEFEKAHPRFFDLLLQILGEGRLTDAAGRTADFCSSVVIMTSNLGAGTYQRGQLGFGAGEGPESRAVTHFRDEVRKFLRPEIYNRIDSIVPFLPLNREAICRIAHRELELIIRRDGIRRRGIDLQVAGAVVERLADQGWDVRYGARPLKRTLERKLLAPLAEQLNLYAENAELQARVSLRQERPVVDVKAKSGDTRTAVAVSGEATAAAVMALRRQAQSLDRHERLIAVRNRIDELERMQRELSGREPGSDEERERLAKLAVLNALVLHAGVLLGQAEALEDAIMHQVYRQEEPTERQREQLRRAQTELEEVVLRVFSVDAADADRVTVGIFGKERHLLVQLAEGYLAYAQGHFRRAAAVVQPMSPERLAAFQENLDAEELAALDARSLCMITPLEGEAPLEELPPGRLYGLLIHLRGPVAYAHFEPEAGRHQFVSSSVRASCLVTVTDGPLAVSEVPTGLIPELKIDSWALRRIYDESRADIHDKRLDKHYLWSARRLDRLFDTILADNLRHSAASLLEGA